MRDPVQLKRSFDYLALVVESRAQAGKSTLAAGVKSEMNRRMPGGFDEKGPDLMFGSFREFLDAARDAGIVDYRTALGGHDLEIVSPGTSSPGTNGTAPHGRAPSPKGSSGSHGSLPSTSRHTPRIRRDLWTAFMSWDAGMVRVYDTHADTAYVLAVEPSDEEPHELKRVRQELHEWPDRYRVISPIGEDRSLAWAREFAATVEERVMGTALRFALEVDRPMKAFVEALQTDSATMRRWRELQARRVEQAIRDWAKAEGLDLDPFKQRQLAEPPPADRPMLHETEDLPADDLRAQVHLAVDALSEEELKALSRVFGLASRV